MDVRGEIRVIILIDDSPCLSGKKFKINEEEELEDEDEEEKSHLEESILQLNMEGGSG